MIDRSTSSAVLVSVVIPSFNQGRFIAETLDSVFAQDYQPIEVLVLDGGSTDDTVDVLKRYDGRPGYWWRSERDRGVVDAVNQGMARATGEICGILSSDDCYLPGTVRAAVRALNADAGCALVYADAEYIDATGKHVGESKVGDYSFERLLGRRTYILQSSAFFRKAAAVAAGPWRPEVGYVADGDLWLRMALTGRFSRVAGTWSRYRFHEAQRDKEVSLIVAQWFQAIRDLSPRLTKRQRRFARLGCHLTAYRYTPSARWWARTKAVYAAVATHPQCLFWREFPRLELLQPLRQLLSRCKRLVLGRPAAPRVGAA